MQYSVAACFLGAFLLSWAGLSTYHKWLNPIFGKPKTDMYWFNWMAHGLCVGLAFLPFAAVGVELYPIVIRSVALGATMMVWSCWQENVVWEECGRGALIVLTLPILLI